MILTPKDPRYRRKLETTLKLNARAKKKAKRDKSKHLNPFTMEKKKQKWYQEPTLKYPVIFLNAVALFFLLFDRLVLYGTWELFPALWFVIGSIGVIVLSYLLRNNP